MYIKDGSNLVYNGISKLNITNVLLIKTVRRTIKLMIVSSYLLFLLNKVKINLYFASNL